MGVFNNKKGYSTGFTWIFGIVTLFGLGILYIVFNQVLTDSLVPVILDMNDNSAVDNATKASVEGGINKYMAFFHIMPFVLFFVVIIYMIVTAVRKEKESEYM